MLTSFQIGGRKRQVANLALVMGMTQRLTFTEWRIEGSELLFEAAVSVPVGEVDSLYERLVEHSSIS